jgi:hypothetical protein
MRDIACAVPVCIGQVMVVPTHTFLNNVTASWTAGQSHHCIPNKRPIKCPAVTYKDRANISRPPHQIHFTVHHRHWQDQHDDDHHHRPEIIRKTQSILECLTGLEAILEG